VRVPFSGVDIGKKKHTLELDDIDILLELSTFHSPLDDTYAEVNCEYGISTSNQSLKPAKCSNDEDR